MDEGETAQQAGDEVTTAQIGDRWGDDIAPERQAELEVQLQWWAREVDRGGVPGPFAGVALTGADVFWLAARTLAGSADEAAIAEQRERIRNVTVEILLRFSPTLSALHLEGAVLTGAHLEGAFLLMAHLEGAILNEAHLEDAGLADAHLEEAVFIRAHLEGAELNGAYLKEADLYAAHLEGARLGGAHLERASLPNAHLEGVNLLGAQLEGAVLYRAHLEGADLNRAHLEGADLREAHLEGHRVAESDLARIRRRWHVRAYDIPFTLPWQPEDRLDFPAVLLPANLCLAFFDRATELTGAKLGDADLGCVRVADTHWGEVNLAVVEWGDTSVLRDELVARAWKPPKPDLSATRPTRQEQREERRRQRDEQLIRFREATRANRQLATILRAQGLNDEADRFAYRAQALQRTVLWLQGRRGAAIGSWLLDLVSGYGFKPMRSVVAYIAIIIFFAALYLINGQFAAPHLRWDEALVLSISSFHGRGFFTSGISLGDTLARLAAGEAIIGLLIEITFIATFTQRFFAR